MYCYSAIMVHSSIYFKLDFVSSFYHCVELNMFSYTIDFLVLIYTSVFKTFIISALIGV